MRGNWNDPPDGYSDVPAGKIVAMVTHLDMTGAPDAARRRRHEPQDATPRRHPDLDWYRDLYRRVGEQWLWVSRIQMRDAELAATIQSPLVEVCALAHDGRDEGLLELDFREPGQCEIVTFGVTAKLVGTAPAAG